MSCEEDRSWCGSQLLLSLPDDVLSTLSVSLRPIDVCHLSMCCRSLRCLGSSEKLWSIQCSRTGVLPPRELLKWRSSFSSYRSLCRFLVTARPLLGLWVHQNPELGNVVFVALSVSSVVGCRIVPQELGPLGLLDSPILYAPVFELLPQPDGSSCLFLHGRESGCDYVYPASLNYVDPDSNILLLEVDPSPPSPQFAHNPVSRSDTSLSRSRRISALTPTFRRLPFGDRRKLLDLVATHVRLKVPKSLTRKPIFAGSGDDAVAEAEDVRLLAERRNQLVQMHWIAGGRVNWRSVPGLRSHDAGVDSGKAAKKVLDRPGSCHSIGLDWEEDRSPSSGKKKGVAGFVKDGLKQILGKSNSMKVNGLFSKGNCSSTSGGSGESKYIQLQEFLRASESLGLSLSASAVKLSFYRAWPNMHDNRFALYRLPVRAPSAAQEYAGLWGGSFGWPPGRPADDKPGKALFFLLISYEECEGQRILIATKILEGTHYVLHPNGSAMFVAKVDELSPEPFPWDKDANSVGFEIKYAYVGEGIANGYGFRYPGSKPGSLYVTQNGLLAFVWKETRAVLTLQRVDLGELLKKGEQVPPLSPIANFSYLTKSYSNVFAGYSTASTSLPSPK